jgi:hypothetical protein
MDERERTTGSRRILDLIKEDQKPTEVGRYAGWGSGDDLGTPGEPERTGPAMMPFLRHRASDRWWKVGIGFAYVPAIIVVITVEDWLHASQSVMWISLGLFWAAFMATIYLMQKAPR